MHPCNYSRLVTVTYTTEISSLDANASQIKKSVSITAVSYLNEPINTMMFHFVYTSE